MKVLKKIVILADRLKRGGPQPRRGRPVRRDTAWQSQRKNNIDKSTFLLLLSLYLYLSISLSFFFFFFPFAFLFNMN